MAPVIDFASLREFHFQPQDLPKTQVVTLIEAVSCIKSMAKGYLSW